VLGERERKGRALDRLTVAEGVIYYAEKKRFVSRVTQREKPKNTILLDGREKAPERGGKRELRDGGIISRREKNVCVGEKRKK